MQERRNFIADTVGQFRPILKAAWLAYIQEEYPVEGAAAQELEAAMTGSVLVGEDN